MEQTSIEEIVEYLQFRIDFFPSAETVLNRLYKDYQNLSLEEVEFLISQNLQTVAREFSFFQGKRKLRCTIAIDLHDEPYYGKDLEEEGQRLVFYTKKHGKSKMALRYGTVSIVFSEKSDLPITLGFVVNYINQSREKIVTKLLDLIKDFPIKIDWLLLDGGFASVEVLKELDNRELKWIVRGRYSKKKEYLGDSGESFPYDLKNQYRVEGYLITQKTPKGQTEEVLLLSSKKWRVDVETAKELYKKRFRIENTYRSARAAKIRTTTRKTRLRWVLWSVSHYLEILWNLMRHIHQIQGMDLYLARQKQFIRILIEVISDNLLLELTRDRLIDKGVG